MKPMLETLKNFKGMISSDDTYIHEQLQKEYQEAIDQACDLVEVCKLVLCDVRGYIDGDWEGEEGWISVAEILEKEIAKVERRE